MSLYGSPFQKFAITISIRFNKFKNWLYQIQKYFWQVLNGLLYFQDLLPIIILMVEKGRNGFYMPDLFFNAEIKLSQYNKKNKSICKSFSVTQVKPHNKPSASHLMVLLILDAIRQKRVFRFLTMFYMTIDLSNTNLRLIKLKVSKLYISIVKVFILYLPTRYKVL